MIGTALVTGMAACVAGGAAYLSPHAMRYAQLPSLRRRISRERALILTYDDGPGRRLTPELLDLLSAHQRAKATFFLLGTRAEACPEIVDRLIVEGHAIGSHSYQHHNAWKVPPWLALNDMRNGYRAIARWAPPNVPFRPPYGKMPLPVWLALRGRKAPISWWTVDSGDTWPATPAPQTVVDRVSRAGGGVILLHDFDRDGERHQFVLKMTQSLLDMAHREGMRVKRFADL